MAAVEFSMAEDGIGLIILNRPERMNAIDKEWVENFHSILDALPSDRNVRAVVLTGAGRGFCSGYDLKSSHDFSDAEGPERILLGWDAQERLALIPDKMLRSRQPIIAAINGPAVGGGLAIALASDMRVATRSARFQVSNVRVGLSAAESGMTWLFPRLVGLSRCFELLVTGRPFDAAEAERIGLLTRLVEDGEAVGAAMEIARTIAANSAFGMHMSKDAIYAAMSVPDFRTALAIDIRTQMICGSTGNMDEAAEAFRAGRAPVFPV